MVGWRFCSLWSLFFFIIMVVGDHLGVFTMIYENLIDVKTAAELWNLSETTIKRKCRTGNIISYKLSGIWLIERNQDKPSDGRRAAK